ncbi:MAG: InlB B-repeat-containing protein [Clostridia bacterium]|nr:InlB B-repeat-containing protein [Clostridia bacterium]
MRKNKRILFLLTAVLVLASAIILAACNPQGTTYTLTFLDGDTSVATISNTAGAEITAPTAPEKEGYSFAGWYTDANFSGEAVTPPTFMPAQNITYYAKYELIPTYTLTFVDGNTTLKTITAAAGTAVTAPTPPEKENLKFAGWYLSADFSGDEVTPPTVMPQANNTYYAKYDGNLWNDSFSEVNGDGVLKIDGTYANFTFNGVEYTVLLSSDGTYADFDEEDDEEVTEYCAILNYDTNTYTVYKYGASRAAHALYLPQSNTFNFERCLFFNDEDNTFKLSGQYLGDTAKGTYGVYGATDNEYRLTYTQNTPYFPFEAERIKLTRVFRTDEDNMSEVLVFNAFMAYDEVLYGEYTYISLGEDVTGEGRTLSLDGYGYATYIAADGTKYEGFADVTSTIFDSVYNSITFTDRATGNEKLMILIVGDTSNIFTIVGDEIGIYRQFDITTQTAGDYYLLLTGWGQAYVFYSDSTAYDAEELVATAIYVFGDDGELIYNLDEIEQGMDALLTEAFKTTFRFKLTTYGSGLYTTDAFIIFNEALNKTFNAENGNDTITLDGYTSAIYVENGEKFVGSYEMLEDLLFITDGNGNSRLFRFNITDDGALGTFRKIGLEFGSYYQYSYVTGFDANYGVYLDGEGNAQLVEYDGDTVANITHGTYAETDTESNYTLTFNGETILCAFRIRDFGDFTSEDLRYIYIIYDEDMAGTYTSANGKEKIVLDGFGLNAEYTMSNGVTITGEFAKEWNLITLLYTDSEGGSEIFTFLIDGTNFEEANKNAGVYYTFDLFNDFASYERSLLIDGKYNALLKTDDGELSGTYTYDKRTDVYTISFENGTTLTVKTGIRSTANVFLVYDEAWKGTYTNKKGEKLILDGFGNVEYDGETVACTLMGKNLDSVTFSIDDEVFTFALDKTTNTFYVPEVPCGYYYPYYDGTISQFTWLYLGADGNAQYYVYSKETHKYELISEGVYEATDIADDVYRYIPTEGDGMTFKASTLKGYNIYSLNDGNGGTYKTTVKLGDGNDYEFTLTLDGFGNVLSFICYTEDEDHDIDRHDYSGYYTVDKDGKIMFSAVNYDYGIVYAEYTFELDKENHTFKIISEK